MSRFCSFNWSKCLKQINRFGQKIFQAQHHETAQQGKKPREINLPQCRQKQHKHRPNSLLHLLWVWQGRNFFGTTGLFLFLQFWSAEIENVTHLASERVKYYPMKSECYFVWSDSNNTTFLYKKNIHFSNADVCRIKVAQKHIKCESVTHSVSAYYIKSCMYVTLQFVINLQTTHKRKRKN